MAFKTTVSAFACALALLFTASGCLSRSISGGSGGRSLQSQSTEMYGGEFSESEVLGLYSEESLSEMQIKQALDAASKISVAKGSKVMLIQSGARVPDPAMIRAFERSYSVSVFSGIADPSLSRGSYSRSLRMAAARSGSQKVVCYWGKVESAVRELETKIVSWLPVVGQIVPDKAQKMRIQLKIAVIDVRTGAWDIYSSKTFEDLSVSAKISRESSDQGQIEELKKKVYQAASEEFSTRYSS